MRRLLAVSELRDAPMTPFLIAPAARDGDADALAVLHAMLADEREYAYQVMRTIGNLEGVRRVRIFNKVGRITFSTGPDAGTMVDQSAE